jgi:hypothetical protein
VLCAGIARCSRNSSGRLNTCNTGAEMNTVERAGRLAESGAAMGLGTAPAARHGLRALPETGLRRAATALLAMLIAGTACSIATAQLAKVEVIDLSNVGGKDLRTGFMSLTRDGSAVIVRTQPPPGQGASSFYRVPLANPSAATHLVTVPTSPLGHFTDPQSISEDGRFVTFQNRFYWDRDRGFMNPFPTVAGCNGGQAPWVGATGTLVGSSFGQSCYPTARRGSAAGESFQALASPLLSGVVHSVSPTGSYVIGFCEAEYTFPNPTGGAFVRWDAEGNVAILPPGIVTGAVSHFPTAVSESGMVYGYRFFDNQSRFSLWRWSNGDMIESAQSPHFPRRALGTSDDGDRLVCAGELFHVSELLHVFVWDEGSAPVRLTDKLAQFCGVDTTSLNLTPFEPIGGYSLFAERRVSSDGTVFGYPNTDNNLVHVVLPRGGGTPGNQAQWANSNGGSWGNAANWVGASIANEDSIAVFDRASEYVVSLAQDRKSAGIQVKQGNVTLSSTPGVLLNIDHPSGQCGDFGDAVNVAEGASLSIDGLELFIDRDIEVKGQFRLQQQAKVSDLFASGTTSLFSMPSSQVDLWTGSTLNVDNVSIAGSFSVDRTVQAFRRRRDLVPRHHNHRRSERGAGEGPDLLLPEFRLHRTRDQHQGHSLLRSVGGVHRTPDARAGRHTNRQRRRKT